MARRVQEPHGRSGRAARGVLRRSRALFLPLLHISLVPVPGVTMTLDSALQLQLVGDPGDPCCVWPLFHHCTACWYDCQWAGQTAGILFRVLYTKACAHRLTQVRCPGGFCRVWFWHYTARNDLLQDPIQRPSFQHFFSQQHQHLLYVALLAISHMACQASQCPCFWPVVWCVLSFHCSVDSFLPGYLQCFKLPINTATNRFAMF